MATSKTLTPTNVTISIPEFTDQPDQRVNSNCIDKEADAINALSAKFTDTPAVTDLNNATANNTIYRFNTGASNNPGYNYGLVFVMAEGNNVKQFAINRGGTEAGSISIRSRGSQATWGDWKEVAGTSRTTYTLSAYDSRVTGDAFIYKTGNICVLTGYITYAMTPTSSQTSALVCPSGCFPPTNMYSVAIRNADFKAFPLQISSNGNINILNGGSIASGDKIYIGMTWVV